MGALAAVTDAHDYIAQVSEGYTKDCWIAKFDLQSFFMSIDKNKLASMLVEFIKVNYEGQIKTY